MCGTNLGWVVDSIISPLICSLLSAGIFWWFSFKHAFAKVIFSEVLEHSSVDNVYRTRFQMANIGNADLIDVEMIAVFEMVNEPTITRRYAVLCAGDFNKLPLMEGRKSAHPYCRMYKVDLFIDEITIKEFKRNQYPKPIQNKANQDNLTLEQLFDFYGDRARIKIYVCGTDSLTGARKEFASPFYTKTNIIEGSFVSRYDYNSTKELKNNIDLILQ